MKKFKSYLVALSIFVLLLFSMPTTSSQNISSEFSPAYDYQFSGANDGNHKPNSIESRTPFPIATSVVLNDDVVSPEASLNVRRSQVRAVAENLGQLCGDPHPTQDHEFRGERGHLQRWPQIFVTRTERADKKRTARFLNTRLGETNT